MFLKVVTKAVKKLPLLKKAKLNGSN